MAAGSGSRFGGPKQFADLRGRPVVAWSIDAARRACQGVVLILPPDAPAASWPVDLTGPGGATRSASVRAGLALVPAEAEVIVVHDGARPLASSQLWDRAIEAVRAGADGAVPAVAVTDTVRQRRRDGTWTTLPRDDLVAVQTPQAFRAGALRRVHLASPEATDDAALVEEVGGRVVVIEGETTNVKITGPEDLLVAAALISGSG